MNRKWNYRSANQTSNKGCSEYIKNSQNLSVRKSTTQININKWVKKKPDQTLHHRGYTDGK